MRISDWSSDVCSSDLGLDQWLKLHYMPVGAPGWGSAADTLELAAADFGLAELARAAGDTAGARQFRERSGWWRNLYNPKATPEGGYIQPRNAEGSWPAFDPSSDEGFVEGSGEQYLWIDRKSTRLNSSH